MNYTPSTNKLYMCDSKRQYEYLSYAMFLGRNEIKKGRARELAVYLCPHCDNYHLTHNTKEVDIKKYIVDYKRFNIKIVGKIDLKNIR